MPDVLVSAFTSSSVVQIPPIEVALRLVTALLLGVLIATLYRRTRRTTNVDPSFSTTLILLCVLVAMVTQVIGDNIARAFGLVGALSMVRFRTVVRDTQDTAYVIFAVIVGMAVGAKSLWVAAIGMSLVVALEMVLAVRASRSPSPRPEYLLKVRAGLDDDLDTLVRQRLSDHVDRVELISFGTGKQGGSLEGCYGIVPRAGVSLPDLVKEFNQTDGVLSVQLLLRGAADD
jgi:hypothetical protein